MAASSTAPAKARSGDLRFDPRSGHILPDVQPIFGDAVRHHIAGRIADAVALYRHALFIEPDFAEAHNNLGVALAAQGALDEAVEHYERALVLKPDYADAHANLGTALAATGRIDGAVTHCERAVLLNADHPGFHYNLGLALAAQGRIDEAIACYRRTVALKPEYADAHNNLGNALAAQSSDDALAHYSRALAIDPDHAEAHNNLGNVLLAQGQFDDAIAHFSRAIAVKPANTEAHYPRAEIKTFHRDDADLAALEALAARRDLPPRKAPFIHFALAKALEDCGDYPRAFHHLRKGNGLKRSQIHYDESAVAENLQRLSSVFDRRLMDGFQGRGDPSSVPIFVLGMPRSGSTLIEQILASHPQIHGAGELTDLDTAIRTVLNGRSPAYPACVPSLDDATLRRIAAAYLSRLPATAEGRLHIVDKLPGNFIHVGLIRLILPNARIVHTMRDPIDTCVSCYSKLFTSGIHYSYDLAELGRYYRGYRELMTHWRSILPPDSMLDVVYEDVVDDLEGQARRLIDYCGLPWDDRCLAFHTNTRPIKTASAVQVRRPLFRGSLQRWRKYAGDIGPLLEELGALVPRSDHPVADRDANQLGHGFHA